MDFEFKLSGLFSDDIYRDWMDFDIVTEELIVHGYEWKDIHATNMKSIKIFKKNRSSISIAIYLIKKIYKKIRSLKFLQFFFMNFKNMITYS